MSNKQDIKVAVIGFGLGTRVFHAPFVSAVPGLTLHTILQRSGDEAAKAYPGVKIARTLEEVTGDPEIDLVCLSTPNPTHFEMAKPILVAGKHLVIDKPFTSTSDEALELIALAKAKGVVLAPFHNRRWDGDFKTMRSVIASGKLGRIATIESHFDRYRPLPREGTWKESTDPANGLLQDLGPHLLDQALALFGVPNAITASVRTDRDVTGIEDAFDITLRFDRPGTRPLLYHSRSTLIAAENAPRFLVHGTHGSYRKMGLDPQEPTILSGRMPPPQSAAGDDWLLEPDSAWGTLTIAPNPADPGKLEVSQVPTEPGDYRGFYESVRDAVNGVAPLALGTEIGYRIAKLVELARQSSDEGRTLPVEFAV